MGNRIDRGLASAMIAAAILLVGCGGFVDTAGDVNTSDKTTGIILSSSPPAEFAACVIAIGDHGQYMGTYQPAQYRPTPDGAEVIWMGGMYNAVKFAAISIAASDGGSAVVGKVAPNYPWGKTILRKLDAAIRSCL